MKNMVNKGFKYFVAIMMVFSLMSMNAWANGPESGTSSETGSTTTENKGTTKDTGDSQGDTADQLISNEEKKTNTSKESDDKEGQTDQTTDKKTDYTYEDKKISVKAVLANASAISDQAELRVKEIPESTTEYKKYQEALNKKSNLYSNVLLYDISFMLNGKEVEPTDGNVKVSMSFKDQQLSDDLNVKDNNDLKVIHFKDNDVNKQESLKTTTNVKNETTSFETKSFSPYAVINSTNPTKVEGFDFNSIDLGYGVIAHEYEQSTDSESNAYVDLIKSLNGHFGSSTRFTNAGGNNYIGDLSNDMFAWTPNLQFHAPPAKLYLGTNVYSSNITKNNENSFYVNLDKGTHSGKKIEFSNIGRDAFASATGMKTAQEIITDLNSKYNDIGSYGSEISDSDIQIDLRSLASGTYVVTYNGTILGDQGDKLNVKINKDQHLIVYCPTKQNMEISNYTINGRPTKNNDDENHVSGILKGENDSDAVYAEKEWESKCISFYMPNTKDLTFRECCGIFIAPNANGHTEATSGGIVACKSMKIGNGEWHYKNSKLESPADIIFNGKKIFKDDNWPTVGSYQIVLKEKNSNTTQTISLTHDDNLSSFNKITYSKNGTYYYEIYEEVSTPVGGVTYDPNVYHIKVDVKSVSEYNYTKYYVSNIHYIKNTSKDFNSVQENDQNWIEMHSGSDGYVTQFENSYKKQGITVDFKMSKKLNGKNPGNNKIFNFGLFKGITNSQGKLSSFDKDAMQTTTNNDSSVEFKDIPFKVAGTYYYKISETKSNEYVTSGDIYIKVIVKNLYGNFSAETHYYKTISEKMDLLDEVTSPNIAEINNRSINFKLKKYDESSSTSSNKAYLSGAKFDLFEANVNGNQIIKGDKKGSEETSKDASNMGLATFEGVSRNKSYLLEESKAPDGYNKSGPWLLTIDNDGKMKLKEITLTKTSVENQFTYTEKKSSDLTTNNEGTGAIENTPAEIGDKKIEYTLPSTGGTGTMKYYLLGTLLSMLGVIYIVMKLGKGGLFRKEDHS